MKKDKLPLKTILIIGNHKRHRSFSYYVENNPNIDVKSYIIFNREEFIPKPPKTLDDELKKIWIKHFKLRNLAENNFFRKTGLKKAVPTLEVKNDQQLNSNKTKNFVKKQKFDLAIIYGTGIIKDPLFSVLPDYKVNFHLGLIPHFKGSVTMIWPFLLLQPNNACCTYHVIDKLVDTGEILHQISPVLKRGDGMHETIYRTCLKSFLEFKYVAKELKKGKNGFEIKKQGKII